MLKDLIAYLPAIIVANVITDLNLRACPETQGQIVNLKPLDTAKIEDWFFDFVECQIQSWGHAGSNKERFLCGYTKEKDHKIIILRRLSGFLANWY